MNSNKAWSWASVIAVACVIAGLALIHYQFGNSPNELRTTPDIHTDTVLELSERSREDLRVFVNQDDGPVIGISAIDVDFVKNVKRTTFFYSKDTGLQQVWDTYLRNRTLLPVYSPSASQNERVTALINGVMDCQLFKNNVNSTLWPDGARYIKTICSVSVPPATDSSGDFVGFFNFFLSKEPTAAEKNQLYREAAELSTAIYRRDFTGKK